MAKQSFGMQLAGNAANTLLGQVGSMVFGGQQDRRQLKQQKKLNDLQIEGNKEMSEFERQQQMKMWKDTNFSAQIDEANKAGMSISSLYGGSGAGGATTGGGGGSGVTGTSAGDPNAGTGMGLQMASQLALMNAQKENIEADTANKKAGEGKAIAETDTEKELAALKGNERTISDVTMKEQRTIVEQKAIASIIGNEATKTGIKLDETKINQIATELTQRWKSLELEGKGQEVSERNMERLTEAMLWGAGIQATGNLVKSITDVVMKKRGITTDTKRSVWEGGSRTQTTTKGN